MAYDGTLSEPKFTGLMRAGWGREVVIFPTVEAPPSNYADIENQDGAEPSDIIAGDSNISKGIDVGVVGNLRNGSSQLGEFPVRALIVDNSTQSYRRPGSSVDRRRSEARRARIHGFSYIGEPRDYVTPRLGVSYATDSATEIRMVRTRMHRFPTDSMLIPIPNAYGAWPEGSVAHYKDTTPCLHYDRKNDRLIIFNIYNCNGSWAADDQIMRLAAVSYKQGEDYDTTSATTFFEYLGRSLQLWNAGSALFTGSPVIFRNESHNLYVPPSVTSVELNGNIYVLVTDIEDVDSQDADDDVITASVGCGGFYVTLFNPSDGVTDAFRPIVGPVKPSRGFATRLLGVSAASLRDSVVVATDNYINISGDWSTFKHQIQYVRSTDMKNWGGSEMGRSLPYTLGSINPIAREDDWKPIDVAINNAGIGFAVTSDHEILYTEDGGSTWELEADFEARIDFESICVTRTDLIADAATPDYPAFAFTKDGIVFRRTTRDDAPEWEICAAANPTALVGLERYFRLTSEGDSVKPNVLRANMTAGPCRGVAVQDGSSTRVWLIGQSGTLRYSHDGGANWRRIVPENKTIKSNTDFRAITFFGKASSRYRIALGGEIYHDSQSKDTLAIISHNITTEPNAGAFRFGSPQFEDSNDAVTDDTRIVNCLFYDKDGGRVFFGGVRGILGTFDVANIDDAGDDADINMGVGEDHEPIIIPSDTVSDITSVYLYQDVNPSEILLFTDSSGALNRCTPWHTITSGNTLPWVRYLIDGSPCHGMAPTDEPDDFAVITDRGLYRGNVFIGERRYVNIISLPDVGHYLLACVNITANQNLVEIWRSTDNGVSFQLSENQPTNARWKDVYGRPTLVVLDDGSVLLSLDGETGDYDQKHFWSFDNGDTWIQNSEPEVPLPIAVPAIDSDNSNNTSQGFIVTGDSSGNKSQRRRLTRASLAYGGGPVYSAWQTSSSASSANRQALFRFYDWTVVSRALLGSVNAYDGFAAPHVVPGKAQWIGIDDVRLVFSGLPSVQDYWDLNLRYRYDVRNVNIESPSIFYRSQDDSDVRMIWDRRATDVIEALGDGTRWSVDAFALFGTNFPFCTIRITVPTVSISEYPAEFPTIVANSANYIEFSLNSIIEYGDIGNTETGAILVDNGKQWIPHMWRPAHRTYYIATYSPSDPNTILQVLKILDNTENSLILDASTVVDVGKYFIFGDRFYCDGTNGKLGNGTISQYLPDIAQTMYAFPRMIQLEIPSQTSGSAGSGLGYYQVGSFLFGRKTPLNVTMAPNGGSRKRFNRGFGWSANAPYSEDIGLSGVTSYEQFGRIVQSWSLQYDFIQWWDRDYFFNGVLDKPKRAFAIQFDNKVHNSIELVRLVDPPSYQNVSGDYYDFGLNLVEVV